MTLREDLAALHDKFDRLADLWGNRYLVKAGVVLERGTLWLKRTDKAWKFKWEEKDLKPCDLGAASVEARLDGVHALPDLQRELERTRDRRVGDITEANAILDHLLAEVWNDD